MGIPVPKFKLKESDECSRILKSNMGNMLAVGYEVDHPLDIKLYRDQ